MDAQSLIACWELARRRHPLDRALLLHAAAEPDADPDTLADRSLGERNAALLHLRRLLFGDELKSCVDCPECGERLEFALSANALLTRWAERFAAGATGGKRRELTVDGHVLRLPTTRDLASIAVEADEPAATRKLLARLCRDGDAAQWSAELEAQVTHALDEADPCIDLTIALACPACAHQWSAPFDVPGFLWQEVDVRAQRLLDEVHALARSYCWSERHILELSDERRNAYLERVLA